MVVRAIVLGGALGLVALLLVLGPVDASTSDRAGPTTDRLVTDQRRDPFVELEDGRTLAQIDSRLGEDAAGVFVGVRIDALGSGVEPPSGFDGRPGANLLTARELTRLVEDGQIEAAIFDGDCNRVDASLRADSKRAVPIRALTDDGGLDYHAMTDSAFTTAIEVSAVGLAHGRYRVDVYAAGEVRLTGTFETWPGGGRLDGFQAAGGMHRSRRLGGAR